MHFEASDGREPEAVLMYAEGSRASQQQRKAQTLVLATPTNHVKEESDEEG